MPVSIMNVIKLSTMSQGVPNNFLNKECKDKINYTRHIFEKKKKKKKKKEKRETNFPIQNEETNNETSE